MTRKRGSRKKKAVVIDVPAPPVSFESDSKRRKSVGISFLKLTLTNKLFHLYPSYNEGQLTAAYEKSIKGVRQQAGRQSTYAAFGNMVIQNGKRTNFTFEKDYISTNVNGIFNKFKTEHHQHVDLIYQEKEFLYLEEKIGYTFRNRALLLQAFTNGSHELAKINGTYQRLEFLGDAILEYVIVFYLYNHPSKFNREVITQYRGMLTSNKTLAILSVKYDLQNYILHGSKSSICSSEKARADIFESFVAAVFLDSGMDLDIVWNVLYQMFKKLKCFKKLDSKI